MHREMFLLNKY